MHFRKSVSLVCGETFLGGFIHPDGTDLVCTYNLQYSSKNIDGNIDVKNFIKAMGKNTEDQSVEGRAIDPLRILMKGSKVSNEEKMSRKKLMQKRMNTIKNSLG